MDVRMADGVEEEGGTKDGKLVLVQWVYKAGCQVRETSDGRRSLTILGHVHSTVKCSQHSTVD